MEKKINLNNKFSGTIDLVLPAFNEENSIKKCIENFEALKIFNCIIVVDNNSTDNTKDYIKQTNAKYILEKEQGYGAALIRGMKEASADIVVTCEPDLTFSHLDVFKFIEYLNDFDCVFGTRTSKSMIQTGSKMYSYLRYGNIIVAKILEYLFKGPSLTDVGCSFKAMRIKAVKEVIDKLKVKGSHFQPELMIRLIQNDCRIIEIPIFYLRRVGYSKITYNFYSSFRVALNMLILIIYLFVLKLFKF